MAEEREPFSAGPNDGIVLGHCVIIDDDGNVCYGGPLKRAPLVDGKLVLLHPQDFEKLRQKVEKSRH